MEYNEIEIISKCQAGDLKNFSLLYDRYVKKIYDFIYYRTNHKETAEDLTSRTFMKALEKIGSFDIGKGNFSAWIYRIARNGLIDYYRTKKQDVDICDIWGLNSQEDVARDFDTSEKLKKVDEYLKTLKSEQREIIIMRVWQEMSYKEISEILEKSEANCKMIFSRSMVKLKKEMPLSLLFLLIILKL